MDAVREAMAEALRRSEGEGVQSQETRDARGAEENAATPAHQMTRESRVTEVAAAAMNFLHGMMNSAKHTMA